MVTEMTEMTVIETETEVSADEVGGKPLMEGKVGEIFGDEWYADGAGW